MTGERPLVSIVDDDISVRESLPDLLRLVGYAVEAFSSAEAFLASDRLEETRCLLLDIAMPGMSGPELQQELARRRPEIPIVFITAQRDRDRATASPRLRAVECLFKPFSEAALLEALDCALADGQRRPARGWPADTSLYSIAPTSRSIEAVTLLGRPDRLRR